ncbi:hypothetical protein HQQ94_21305 [Shewanella sp. VB17]|uniref:hypothetical protein n=1 Tax=Shewanella sp. VB17 TaxID=2739432 RepID=UPI001565635D|nr:hypothetical protein [Shewanella sp. VB17]NRD75710.1 hypothetical protein [Shewanella sp. VB17]
MPVSIPNSIQNSAIRSTISYVESNNIESTPVVLQKSRSLPSLQRFSSTLEQRGMQEQHLTGLRLSKSEGNLHKEGRVITDNLSAIVDKLNATEVISNSNPAVKKPLLAIRIIMDKPPQPTGIMSINDTANLSYQFEKLAKLLPKGEVREICSLLGQNMKSGWITQKNQELNSEKKQQLAPLGTPGASETKSVSVGVSTGVSLLPSSGEVGSIGPSVDLSGGIQKSTGYSSDDETLFFIDSGAGSKVKVGAGVKAQITEEIGAKLGANAQLSHTRTTFKEYDSVEQYVDRKGHKLNSANRKQYIDSIKPNKATNFIRNHLPFNLGSELKDLKSERQQAANSQHRLNDLLKTVLDIEVNIKAAPIERSKPLMGHYNTWVGEVKLEANAGMTAEIGDSGIKLAAGAGASHQRAVTNIYEFVPSQFYDVIKGNADKLDELPANMTRHAKEIVPENFGSNAATKGLKLLSQDLDSYYKTVQQYDYFKSAKNKNPDAIKQFKQCRIDKHTIENRWGAIGRHQFVQFANASHAYLANKAVAEDPQSKALTDEQSKNKMDLIANVAIKTQSPPITHSRKRLDKIATFTQQIYLKITDKKTGINISAGPFSAQLDVLQRERIHPSRIRDGSYVDLNLTWKVSGSVQGLVDKASITAKINDAAAKEGVQLPQEFEFSPDLSGGKSGTVLIRFFKPNYAKESDFDGDKGYRRQFVRHLSSVSAGSGLGAGAMIAPAVNVGANVAFNYSKTTVSGEKIGTEDLTYSMTRYNRAFRNAGKDPANKEWQSFANDNKVQYQKMFSHLGDKTHQINKEAQHFLNELVDKAPDEASKSKAQSLSNKFNQAMNDFQADPTSEDKFNDAKVYFNDFLEQQTQPWWADHTSSWTDLPFKQKSDSGLDLGTRIKKGLHLHERVKEQTAIHRQEPIRV